MNHYASLAIAGDLPIQSLKITVRGHIIRKLPSAFRDMLFQVFIEGDRSEEQLKALAKESSLTCFVENTLAKSIPVTTEVHLNGRKALTLNRTPQDE